MLPKQEALEEDSVVVKFRGGILADEMGLGKTLTTIALIHSNPMIEDPMKDPLLENFGGTDDANNAWLKSRATLSNFDRVSQNSDLFQSFVQAI